MTSWQPSNSMNHMINLFLIYSVIVYIFTFCSQSYDKVRLRLNGCRLAYSMLSESEASDINTGECFESVCKVLNQGRLLRRVHILYLFNQPFVVFFSRVSWFFFPIQDNIPLLYVEASDGVQFPERAAVFSYHCTSSILINI